MRALVVRVLSFAVALGVLVSLAGPAEAQTVTLGAVNGITRKLYPTAFRPLAQKPYSVNQADCVNQDVITFPVTLGGAYAGLNFQVWAGAVDCTPITQRQSGGSSTCWMVFQGSYSGLSNGAVSIPIYARNIVARNTSPTNTGSALDTGTIPEQPVSVCYAGGGAFQALNLAFMLVDSTQVIAGNNAAVAVWTQTGYDITPPAPPGGITLGAGEGRIHVSWTPSTDPDVYGYNFYCDPPPGALNTGADASLLNLGPSLRTEAPALPGLDSGAGSGGLSGAGGTAGAGGTGVGGTDAGASRGGAAGSAGGTAGASGAGGGISKDGGTSRTDGGAIIGLSCSGGPSPLAAGALPDQKYFCGQTLGNPIGTGTGTAENLVNGQIYGVSVGAIDGVGNVGVLSAPQCETPVVITDFFELYRGYGGKGGCSIARVADRRGPALPAAALGAAVSVTALRRRRRRR